MWKVIFSVLIMLSLSACETMRGSFRHPASSSREATDYLPKQREASGKRTFLFSPRHLVWAAYDEAGDMVRSGHAAGGSAECPEDGSDCRTTVGNFIVQRKGGADCKSSKYPLDSGGGAPMAYCMHFNKGYAIHGAPGDPNVHQSHGCIRVRTHVARWLNQDFLRIGSKVIVQSY
jgi:hypothetical protein